MEPFRPSIPDFFAGRHILVTGGTGFMGKVLIEKLLRSCPQLEAIYLLVRPKKGQMVRERMADFFNVQLFDLLKKSGVAFQDKVIPVESSITKPDLGLTPADRETLRNKVSIIFHSAATVKFEEKLKESVLINMAATKYIIQLAQEMPKLEAMIHVSTAYCNCNRSEVSEQVYPELRDPELVLQAAHMLDDELLDYLTPKFVGNRPNTYTYTKALAEQLVMAQSGLLPIAIIRPSIVTATWKEPFPGWVDNLNGPTGMIVGAGKGVLRTLLIRQAAVIDFIPVDIAINCFIAAAYHTAVARPNNIRVYNCTTGASNPLHWSKFEDLLKKYIIKYPSSEVLWYPGGSFKRHDLSHSVAILLFHKLPAYLIDSISLLLGRKPQLVQLQKKIQKALKSLEFFTIQDFKFSSDNVQQLWASLSPEDKSNFDFDIASLDWVSYVENYVTGTRKFILKEDPDSIPVARSNLMKKYILHLFAKASLLSLFCWCFVKNASVLKSTLFYMLSMLFAIFRSYSSPMLTS